MLLARRVDPSKLLPSGRHFSSKTMKCQERSDPHFQKILADPEPKRIPPARLCRTPSSFYPVFFDFVLSASRLASALRSSGFPSAQALSIVILLKRHLSRSRIRLQSQRFINNAYSDPRREPSRGSHSVD